VASSPRRAGVLGRPIAHSLSPVLHTAAYAALGLDWTYEAIECGVAELPGVVADRADWAGFSCTMPLKHAALSLAQEATARATAIGAANTLLPLSAGGWRADNTDVDGILAALAEADVRPASVTVLGAGGTAQAAVAAVAELGIATCGVLARDITRTAALARTAERLGVQLVISGLTDDAMELDADLVISTLPPGAGDGLASRAWRSVQTVFDVVYAPWPTALAASATAGGATVVSGAAMLLHQAAAQVALMTGRDAPVEPMRAALRERLSGDG